MAKITLTPSCCVTQSSYDRVKGAYEALRKTNPSALAALIHACNQAQPTAVDVKHRSTLSKHHVVGRDGTYCEEVKHIVKVALRNNDGKMNWVHNLHGRRISR